MQSGKNETLSFIRINSIKLVPTQPNAANQTETELFKLIEEEQSKQLIEKLKSINLNKEQAKEKIIAGVIGTPNWSAKWKPIHEKNEQLHQSIQQHKATLNGKQQQLQKLALEVGEMEQALCTMEDNKETLDFYDRFLEPIAEAEKELKSGFEEKLKAGKYAEFTVDEVSLFLNLCDMKELVSHQRQKQIDGEMLEYATADVAVMEIKDSLQRSKMEFHLKVLESGKMMNEEVLMQSMVWRHRSLEKSLLLMKEWEIGLDEELVIKKGICIYHLLYFNAKDFHKELGVEMKQAARLGKTLKRMRKEFEEFLTNG